MDDWLTNSGLLNLKQIDAFIEYLGGVEDQVFKQQLERNMKKQAELEQERKQIEGESGEKVVEAGTEGDPAPASAVPPAMTSTASKTALPSAVKEEDDAETAG